MLGVKIAVLAKYCVDPANLRIDPAKGVIDFAGSPKKISEADLNAVEEAVRIKGSLGGSIHIYSVAPFEASKLLRETLAMGADKAYLIADVNIKNPDANATAHILSRAIEKNGPYDLVLAGYASEDRYAGSVAVMVAELLGLPHVAYATKIEASEDSARVERNLGDKVEMVEVKLPAMITVTPEINQPRVVTSLQVMKVPRDAVVNVKLEDLGITPEEYASFLLNEQVELSPVVVKRKNILIEEADPAASARKLVELLKNEGVI